MLLSHCSRHFRSHSSHCHFNCSQGEKFYDDLDRFCVCIAHLWHTPSFWLCVFSAPWGILLPFSQASTSSKRIDILRGDCQLVGTEWVEKVFDLHSSSRQFWKELWILLGNLCGSESMAVTSILCSILCFAFFQSHSVLFILASGISS